MMICYYAHTVYPSIGSFEIDYSKQGPSGLLPHPAFFLPSFSYFIVPGTHPDDACTTR
jgi:hypothetical protein